MEVRTLEGALGLEPFQRQSVLNIDEMLMMIDSLVSVLTNCW